jgi:tripartite-type tricarboxylate transporter receptor subunit TctC
MPRRNHPHLVPRGLAALLLAGLAAASVAQGYPTKPIRLVLPFPPGGGTDALARILTPRLNERLGQSIVIDNRPGAAGNISADIVAKSAPDGYTLLMGFSTVLTTSKSLYAKLPFDPERDFVPVTQLATAQYILVLHPSVAAKTLPDLIALARAKPGALNYASSGVGSPLHLAAELFKARAGIDLVHVAYKGGGPAAAAVLGGETQVLFGSVASSLPHIRSGRLRALAVTGARRSQLAADLPTIAESGFPGFNVTAWDSVLAPRGTAREIVTRLHAEIAQVLKVNEVREQINNVGYEPTGTTPDELAAIIRTESATWAKVIRDANIRAE